jgi:hypothetical protein
MSATKITLIVLALCAVLFIVVLIWGSGTNASEKNLKNNFDPSCYPTLASVNQMLAPFAPKVDLKDKTFDLSRATPTTPIRVQIPKDDSHKFRNAKFQITPGGCAHIEYRDPSSNDSNLNDQPYPKPGAKFDPTQASFVVLQSGGNLTLNHASSAMVQECVARLQ